MAEVNHFTYGWVNPAMGFTFAFIGSLLALACMNRARQDTNPIRSIRSSRIGWIILASLALGGTAIWMMHFTAMIGFRVIGSSIAYDPWMTLLSLVASISAVSFGLFVAGASRKRSVVRVLVAGPPTGAGVVLMHYMGMHAINISGMIHHDRTFVIASIAIALVAATVALFFALWLKGRAAHITGALIMAVAISAMHYTGMAGVQVTVYDEGRQQVEGIDPIMLTIPILVVATILIIVLLFTLFAKPGGGPGPRDPQGPSEPEPEVPAAPRQNPTPPDSAFGAAYPDAERFSVPQQPQSPHMPRY
ncbi:MHYT domain-containing protein [Salininema proteolyticum]|uniref:MHYT domain-containing protein n=1 Tax=Salininema proteolyticum TaxID=1607685 RepID=A0ABV8TU69_9ACTN